MANNKKIGGKTVTAGVFAAITGAIALVVNLEGGYVDNPNDPGGKTNHGITEKVARDHGYKGHMRDLTQEAAVDIYAEDFVIKPGYDNIFALSTAVGEELVDSAVNAGASRSSRWFQKAVNQLNSGGRGCPAITVDGRVGPASAEAFACLQRTRGKARACQMTVKLMDAQQASHYMSLVDSNPKFQTFIVGWVDHRVGNTDLTKC